MALENEGSNPSAHPIVSIREEGFPLKRRNDAPVAQWIRALVFGTKGRGFESLRARHGIERKIEPLDRTRGVLWALSNIFVKLG